MLRIYQRFTIKQTLLYQTTFVYDDKTKSASLQSELVANIALVNGDPRESERDSGWNIANLQIGAATIFVAVLYTGKYKQRAGRTISDGHRKIRAAAMRYARVDRRENTA